MNLPPLTTTKTVTKTVTTLNEPYQTLTIIPALAAIAITFWGIHTGAFPRP